MRHCRFPRRPCSGSDDARLRITASPFPTADLKPANVLLKGARNLRGFICKLADFGLSRLLGAGDTHVDTASVGTPSHSAPEVRQWLSFRFRSFTEKQMIALWHRPTLGARGAAASLNDWCIGQQACTPGQSPRSTGSATRHLRCAHELATAAAVCWLGAVQYSGDAAAFLQVAPSCYAPCLLPPGWAGAGARAHDQARRRLQLWSDW